MVTLAGFRTLYPRFDSVADATVQAYLDAAELELDEGVWGDHYESGVYALACHEMMLQGLGETPEGSLPVGNVTALKDGAVSVSFKQTTNESLGDDYYNQTACGQKYLRLMRLLGNGIVVIPATSGV